MSSFNASMYVSEQLTRQLINIAQDLAERCVQECGTRYNFDPEEAIRFLGLSKIKMERKAPEKVKEEKKLKVAVPKTAFPLPYNGEFNDACCYALRQNNGLYTQCPSLRKKDASFCKGCANQMQKIGAEVPEYGTIQQRTAVGIFEYVDPKGRKPTPYCKIMKRYKLTEEQVLAEASKVNMTINPEHFIVPEDTKRGRPKVEKEPKEKGAKGRPKKAKKVLQIEGDDDDLFQALVAQANEDTENVVIAPKKGKTEEEKEAERLAKEAEKAEKEAKRLAEKAEKEAKLAAEKAEREAKKEAERIAREEKKKAEEEARAAKKKAEEDAKEAKRLAAEQAKAEKEAKKTQKKTVEPEEEQAPDVVKKIEFEGKKYLKSKNTGVIYDYNAYVKEGEQVILGKWSDAQNKIIFNNSEEEEEEEYDM